MKGLAWRYPSAGVYKTISLVAVVRSGDGAVGMILSMSCVACMQFSSCVSFNCGRRRYVSAVDVCSTRFQYRVHQRPSGEIEIGNVAPAMSSMSSVLRRLWLVTCGRVERQMSRLAMSIRRRALIGRCTNRQVGG